MILIDLAKLNTISFWDSTMSPPHPDRINIAGQPYTPALLEVLSRHKDGTPLHLRFIPMSEAVSLDTGPESVLAYLPKSFVEGDQS